MSRTTYLSEAARLQRLIALEAKREMLLRGNPAEESARANIPFGDRSNISDEIEIDEPEIEIAPAPADPQPVVVDDDAFTEPPKEKRDMAKPTVVIVGADKGGVGKTTVSRTVLDYF